ncbi:MAG: winged helix-turn-helix domain-containing protein [Candidatus Bathyarchaeota archaeon]|nr:winged helix-turn-helix domain-containing protein [Chloroflexota bacterium]MCL5876379.1 winged helix-turn-helix domain-containing protein [Candidatus Bathyarchaeota archaeon]
MTWEIIDYKAKRRDKLIIMMEIIYIAKGGTSKTHIMFKANLSFSQLNEYINFLTKHGLLQKTLLDGKAVYVPTGKGLEFVEKQQSIIGMFSDDCYKSPLKVSLFNHAGEKGGKGFGPALSAHC